MSKKAKDEATSVMRVAIQMIESILQQLQNLFLQADMNQAMQITMIQSDLNERRQRAAGMVSHLEAAESKVAPLDDKSYEAIDAALKKLQGLEQNVNDVKRAIAVGRSIAEASKKGRSSIARRLRA